MAWFPIRRLGKQRVTEHAEGWTLALLLLADGWRNLRLSTGPNLASPCRESRSVAHIRCCDIRAEPRARSQQLYQVRGFAGTRNSRHQALSVPRASVITVRSDANVEAVSHDN